MKAWLTRLARILTHLQAVSEELKAVYLELVGTGVAVPECQSFVAVSSSQGLTRSLGSLLRRSLSLANPTPPSAQSCFEIPRSRNASPKSSDRHVSLATAEDLAKEAERLLQTEVDTTCELVNRVANSDLCKVFSVLLRMAEVLFYHAQEEDVAERLSATWGSDEDISPVLSLDTMLDKTRGVAKLFDHRFRSRVRWFDSLILLIADERRRLRSIPSRSTIQVVVGPLTTPSTGSPILAWESYSAVWFATSGPPFTQGNCRRSCSPPTAR